MNTSTKGTVGYGVSTCLADLGFQLPFVVRELELIRRKDVTIPPVLGIGSGIKRTDVLGVVRHEEVVLLPGPNNQTAIGLVVGRIGTLLAIGSAKKTEG